MLSLKPRQFDAPQPSALSEFEAAKKRWSEVTATDRELREKRDAILLARSLASSPTTTMPKPQQQRAAPYRKLAAKSPGRLAAALEDVETEIEAHAPIMDAAREAWAAAQRREANRIAAELQPRQRDAVRRMADALEALSRAIEDEAEIHDEFRQRAPLPTSALLPNIGGEFADLAVGRQFSRGWLWAHRVNKLGVLNDA